MDAHARTGLSRRSLIALPLCVLVLAALSVHRLACTEPPDPYVEFSGPTMGTLYSVKLSHVELTPEQRSATSEVIVGELDRVNALMSTYVPDSEVSRFNRLRSTEPFAVARETLEVFEVAQKVSEQSGGAFDITVGPLVQAWGFGATDRPMAPPDPEELAALRERVGYQRIRIDAAGSTISKTRPDVECDLSAIAKGYGVDRVALALERLGYANFLVEVGGELRGRGRRADGAPWRIGVEQPDALARTIHEVIALEDMSLATSGDYRNYYEVDGQRVSHTIDPRAGRPISHALASVSVLHPEATWADALATALDVLGPDEGRVWAEQHELPALFLVREPDGSFRQFATASFDAVQVREARK